MRNRLLAVVAVLALPLVVLLVVGLVGRDGGSAAAGPQGDDQIRIADFAFAPDETHVKVGTTVTWTNNDSFDHSVEADDGSFQSKDLGQGATFAFTFDKTGRFAYVCGIHNSMQGVIVVE